jgi:CheY-like chemotaxis protein
MNGGTEVHVALPMQPCLSTSVPSTNSVQNISGLKVLLAEDNKVTQMIVRKYLEKRGVRLYIANNGAEAVDIAKAQPLDLVFMDLSMPIMDGFVAFSIIHAQKPELPVIALTANALPEDEQTTLVMGMREHIRKPFTEQQLVACIQRYNPSLTGY